jgi:leucyl/phenylalanyl-tRNA--protein transferase
VIPSDLLLAAYSSGWFPMAGDGGELSWYSPDPRGIIPLDRFHASSRLLRVVRRGTYRIAVDTVFEAVIRACAESDRGPEDAGTWISEEIIHRATDASKVALVALIERLRTRGFGLLDTQWVTEHLRQFGAIEIPRAEYLRLLETNLQRDASFA